MSILSTITSGIDHSEGVRIVLAGQEKIGKTTLATDAPNALLVPLEVGYKSITIPKTRMIQTYQDFEILIGEIFQMCQTGNFPFKTLVFDSATALERMIHQSIIELDPAYSKKNQRAVTMESALGGYGKAYTFANEKFMNLLNACDQLAVTYGINIIFTCHVFAAKLMDPLNGEYDSWDLLLHSPKNQKTYGKRELITQWADIIGFLHEPMFVTKGDNISKGVSAQKGRMLALSRTPSYVAGNRFNIVGEVPIPATDGWNHLANALYQSTGMDTFNRKQG